MSFGESLLIIKTNNYLNFQKPIEELRRNSFPKQKKLNIIIQLIIISKRKTNQQFDGWHTDIE